MKRWLLVLALVSACGGSKPATKPADVSVSTLCDNAVLGLTFVPEGDPRGQLAGAQTHSLESCTRAEWLAAVVAHPSPGTLAANLDELCARSENAKTKVCA